MIAHLRPRHHRQSRHIKNGEHTKIQSPLKKVDTMAAADDDSRRQRVAVEEAAVAAQEAAGYAVVSELSYDIFGAVYPYVDVVWSIGA